MAVEINDPNRSILPEAKRPRPLTEREAEDIAMSLIGIPRLKRVIPLMSFKPNCILTYVYYCNILSL
jgi:hypothetical protein